MAAVFTGIIGGAGELGDRAGVAGGRWDEPTQANVWGTLFDGGETAGLDEVGIGSVEMFCRAHVGIIMRGEEGVPRRSPGSRSVDPDSGNVWYPLATKVSASDETPSLGSMSTRQWPVRAGTPEGWTKLTRTRNGVDENEIACTPASSRWEVSVVGRWSLMKVERSLVRGTERECSSTRSAQHTVHGT